MGILHTPRTLFVVAKGAYKHWQHGPSTIGLGSSNPHVYTARMGLVDFDYNNHMNNAAYLAHAEYSRWQMSAENGLLQAGIKHKAGYILSSTSVRFRREIKPFFRKFQVHSAFVALNDKFAYTKHDFRYAEDDDKNNKIRAQVIAKGAFMQGRKILNPRDFLVHSCHFDTDLIDPLHLKEGSLELKEILALSSLEEAQRASASADDVRIDDANKK